MPDFSDDSSGALGLNHSSHLQSGGIARWKAQQDAETESRLRELGIACDVDGRPQVQHIVPDNAGAHDSLAVLLDAGWEWRDALDALDAFTAANLPESEIDEDGPVESDSDAFFAWCMKAPVTPDKRSSRSRGKKNGGKSSTDPLQGEVIRTYGRVA